MKGGLGLEVGRSLSSLRYEIGTNGRVRADERALCALNTFFDVPFGNENRDSALFELRRTGGNGTVRIKCGGRKFIAFERENGRYDIAEILIVCELDHFRAFGRGGPGGGNIDFHEVGLSGIDGVIIHLNDRVALSGEGLVGHVFHERHSGILVVGIRAFVGHDLMVDAEESGL